MKMMNALFVFGCIFSARVKAGLQSFLHTHHHVFIFHLHLLQACTSARVEQLWLADVGDEGNLGLAKAQWLDNVERKSPGIEIEHGIGEEPEIIGGNALAKIRGLRRQVESDIVFLGDCFLQHSIGQAKRFVLADVDAGVECGMHEGNMKALQIILNVQHPIGIEDKVFGAGAVEPELHGNPLQNGLETADQGFEGSFGSQAAKEKLAPFGQGQVLQMIIFPWKIGAIVKTRCQLQLSVQAKPSTVVIATQDLARPRLARQEIASVGADIGEQANLAILGPCQHQWLAQKAFEQVEGKGRTRLLDRILHADPLPRLSKDLVFHQVKNCFRSVEISRRRTRQTDIGVVWEKLRCQIAFFLSSGNLVDLGEKGGENAWLPRFQMPG